MIVGLDSKWRIGMNTDGWEGGWVVWCKALFHTTLCVFIILVGEEMFIERFSVHGVCIY